MVYQTVREVFTLATSKQTYTMGVAGDFNTSRPVEILDANYVQSTLETPIKLITDHQWAAIPIKNMSGIPQKLYVDGASTLQNLNFWPYPAAGNQVVIYSKKQLSSIALIGDTLDFPPGYKKALKYNLAGELALEYGKTINPVLGAIAAESKAAIARKNKRPIYMSPDITTSRKRRYRMETGEQMKFPGFIGPAYTVASLNVDCQRCVNLYPVLNEMGKGKADEIAYLLGTPGLELLATVGSGPIRLVHFDGTKSDPLNPTTRAFIVSGNEVYKFLNVAGTWTATLLGTLDTSVGTVKAASETTDLGQTVFVDGANQYLFKKTTISESFGTFASFSLAILDDPPTGVIFVDGYFIYCNGTNQFYVSNVNELEVDPLSFASAEGDPDNIISIISNRRDIILGGERSIELWINSGDADFPFTRASGGFIEKGISAKYSLAKADNMFFWLGRDAAGQGVVYAGQGLNPERISTHAIEQAIAGYADMTTAVAYTYQEKGHTFYVLNFDEATWVFDLASKLWHERAYLLDGNLIRHRAQYHAFIPEFGIHMLGDYENGKVYQYNDEYYFDDTAPIKRLRTSPHVSQDEKNIFGSKFQLVIESGVGLDGTTQGTDPQVMLQLSKDGGHSWENERWVSMGKIGQRVCRAIWRRLGVFRDLVVRVAITDPVKVVMISADIEIELGEH